MLRSPTSVLSYWTPLIPSALWGIVFVHRWPVPPRVLGSSPPPPCAAAPAGQTPKVWRADGGKKGKMEEERGEVQHSGDRRRRRRTEISNRVLEREL